MHKKKSQGRSHSPLSFLLVGTQGVFIGLIAITGTLWPETLSLRGFFALGAVFGGWALYVVGLGHVRIFPEIPSQGKLVVNGPYSWVRHPMYTSVLVVTLSWTLGNPIPYGIGLWVGLLMTLLIKLHYEERLLKERFPEYTAYHSHTKRLIPFVW